CGLANQRKKTTDARYADTYFYFIHSPPNESLTISSLLWVFLPQSRAPTIWPIAGVEFAHGPVILLDIFSKRHIVIHSKFRHSVFRKPAVGPDHITHGSQLHLRNCLSRHGAG